jgi:hypothetical protein
MPKKFPIRFNLLVATSTAGFFILFPFGNFFLNTFSNDVIKVVRTVQKNTDTYLSQIILIERLIIKPTSCSASKKYMLKTMLPFIGWQKK